MDLQMKGVWSSEFASQVADTRNALRQALILAREYKRDADGQFSSGGGGGGDDDEGEGPPDPFDAPYAELNLNDDGSQRFSQSYREKYGSIVSESGDFNDHYLAQGEKGKLHIADDTHGSRNREVLQEFTKTQAKSLGDDVYAVGTGGATRTNKATEVKVEPNNRVYRSGEPGYNGVDVTWSSGARSHFDDVAAFDLQEALSNA